MREADSAQNTKHAEITNVYDEGCELLTSYRGTLLESPITNGF